MKRLVLEQRLARVLDGLHCAFEIECFAQRNGLLQQHCFTAAVLSNTTELTTSNALQCVRIVKCTRADPTSSAVTRRRI